jgi:hypothetical protein
MSNTFICCHENEDGTAAEEDQQQKDRGDVIMSSPHVVEAVHEGGCLSSFIDKFVCTK